VPGLLYLETNYVIGCVEGRIIDFLSSCEREGPRPTLAMPSLCILESLSVLERRRKETARFVDALSLRIGEVRRDRSSSHAPELLANLEQARTGVLGQHNECEARLKAVISELCTRAELVETGPAVIRDALDSPLIEKEPTDNLILHAILDHARRSSVRDKGFFSENTRDFGTAEVKATLRSVGVRYLARPEDVVGWLRSLRRRRP
jgi:hypothetical protein